MGIKNAGTATTAYLMFSCQRASDTQRVRQVLLNVNLRKFVVFYKLIFFSVQLACVLLVRRPGAAMVSQVGRLAAGYDVDRVYA